MQESYSQALAYIPYWLAPEILLGGTVTSDSDVYSFGILVLELLNGGKNPFEGFSLA
jgi:serine/threonine protein kinase